MVEAVRPYASPAAIWAIVAVGLVALAFWLTAIMVADTRQARTSRRRRMLRASRPVQSISLPDAGSVPAQWGAGMAAEPPRSVRSLPAAPVAPEPAGMAQAAGGRGRDAHPGE